MILVGKLESLTFPIPPTALGEALAPTPPPYTEASFVETGTDSFTEPVSRAMPYGCLK